jgi:hypothetical protein
MLRQAAAKQMRTEVEAPKTLTSTAQALASNELDFRTH